MKKNKMVVMNDNDGLRRSGNRVRFYLFNKRDSILARLGREPSLHAHPRSHFFFGTGRSTFEANSSGTTLSFSEETVRS